MNKHTKNIESDLTTAGLETSLSTSERSEMLENLRAYTAFHPAPMAASKPVRHRLLTMYTQIAAGSAVALMVIGTGVMSSFALPGHTLYPVKVDVVEPLLGVTRGTQMQQLQYQEELMEKRLFEMQELARTDTLTKQTAEIIGTEISQRGSDISELLVENIDSVEYPSETTEVVSSVVSLVRAQERIEDLEIGEDTSSQIDAAEIAMTRLYDTELEDFLTETPESVPVYIEKILDEVHDSIIEDIAVLSDSSDELGEYLEKASSALASGDIAGALESTADAQQVLEVNKYLAEDEVLLSAPEDASGVE